MALKVFLAASLRKYLPGCDPASGYPVEITPGKSIRDLVRQLSIPEEEVKLITVNGTGAMWDTALRGDEHVGLFPAVGGG